MPALSRSSIVVENVTAPILLWCRLGGKAVDFLQTLGCCHAQIHGKGRILPAQ
ncbi:hypothetical protein F444_14026, partial [Phytophthora nicotianae P1976]